MLKKPKKKTCEIQQLCASLLKNEAVAQHLIQASTEWYFMPPSSPHSGGIWEGAIKSTKYHFKREIGKILLTN